MPSTAGFEFFFLGNFPANVIEMTQIESPIPYQ